MIYNVEPEKIAKLISEVANIDPPRDYTLDLYSDLGVKSVRSIDILFALEETYDINLSDEEFIRSRNINSIVEMLDRCSNREGGQ